MGSKIPDEKFLNGRGVKRLVKNIDSLIDNKILSNNETYIHLGENPPDETMTRIWMPEVAV